MFGLGAILSAAWAYQNISGLLIMYESGGGFFRTEEPFGLLTNVLPAFLTWWLAACVRNYGGSSRIWRRMHQVITLTIVSLVVLFVGALATGTFAHGVNGIWVGLTATALVAIALWLPLQGLFASVFVGLLIKGPRPIS